MSAYVKTLRDVDGNADLIDEAGGGVRIEWSASPMIVWNENLHFHIKLAQKNADEGLSFSDYVEKLKDDGRFPARVADELTKLLPLGFESDVAWSDMDDDEYEEGDSPFLKFSVWKKDLNLPLTTPVEDAYDLLWPAIATLFNVTDPGTFNSSYLFGFPLLEDA